jgi:two-component system sensor histidine kinase KdpD
MIPVRKMMRLPAYSRNVAHWLAATLVAALGTALQVWLGANSTTAGMVFLVLVVWFAAREGILLSVYVAVLCALSFDYFFLPPAHTLRLTGIQAWVAMVSFLASCAVVGRVAERARGQAIQAEQRREDVERLYALSQEMMLHEDATGLIGDLPRLIERIFALDGVVLYARDHDQFYATTSSLPMSIHASLRAMAQGQSPTLVVPGEFTAKALMLGLRPVGALGWRPAQLSREVATAVSAQVAIALTRATAVEASARMEAAREGERLRAALIDSLTHELRTPLTSIRAAATTLLEATGLDEAGRLELASIVDEESSRLDRLIGEAVEMAEIDANVVEVHPVPQHPRALLEQAVEESRAALAGRRVVIAVEEPKNQDKSYKPEKLDGPGKTERPEALEKLDKLNRQEKLDKPVWFDPHLLSRVLRHLLENAARHTPPGGRILLGCRRHGDRLEFRVEDDGPGVDPADLPFIFEKFYRGREGATRGKGTGMGLPITRAILAAHGGGVEVESAPKRGACFCFWVPLVDREPGSVETEKDPSE